MVYLCPKVARNSFILTNMKCTWSCNNVQEQTILVNFMSSEFLWKLCVIIYCIIKQLDNTEFLQFVRVFYFEKKIAVRSLWKVKVSYYKMLLFYSNLQFHVRCMPHTKCPNRKNTIYINYIIYRHVSVTTVNMAWECLVSPMKSQTNKCIS